jgi:hypothetical protein
MYLSETPAKGSGQITKSITKHAGSIANVNPIVDAIGPSNVAHLAQQYSNTSVLSNANATSAVTDLALGILKIYTSQTCRTIMIGTIKNELIRPTNPRNKA